MNEEKCMSWASDDGCTGDSNGVRCELEPRHAGQHWDPYVRVWWRHQDGGPKDVFSGHEDTRSADNKYSVKLD